MDTHRASLPRTAFQALACIGLLLACLPTIHAQEASELYLSGVTLRLGMPKDEVIRKFQGQGCSITTPADDGSDTTVVACKDGFGNVLFDKGKLVSAFRSWTYKQDDVNEDPKKLFSILFDVLQNQNNMGLATASVKTTHRAYPQGGSRDEINFQFSGRVVTVAFTAGIKGPSGEAFRNFIEVSEALY